MKPVLTFELNRIYNPKLHRYEIKVNKDTNIKRNMKHVSRETSEEDIKK